MLSFLSSLRKMSTTAGKIINCRAAVAWEQNQPFVIENVEVHPPKKREVRIKVLFNALCHSDAHAIDGTIACHFPIILGHEAAGVVESVGEGVTEFQPGDHVIPLYMPQCRVCKSCLRKDTNMCEEYKITEPSGPMADGTCRFSCRGEEIFHFMGLSTFSEYTVVTDTRLTKINPKAPLDKVCLIGCGIATGYGAALNTGRVQPGDSVAIWGLGAVGLSAVMGAKAGGAKTIVAIDMNPKKFEYAKKLGATHCINPLDTPKGKSFVGWVLRQFGAFDKTFECIGNVKCMRQALDCVHKGWGVVSVIGVAPIGEHLSFIPFNLMIGKTITGSVFGGWKSKDAVPKLVEDAIAGKINLDTLITHSFDLAELNHAMDLLKKGESLRSVISLAKM